jgi:hypothetical protein
MIKRTLMATGYRRHLVRHIPENLIIPTSRLLPRRPVRVARIGSRLAMSDMVNGGADTAHPIDMCQAAGH